MITAELEPVDRISLDEIVDFAREALPEREPSSELRGAMQHFRNTVVMELAASANLLLGLDQEVQAIAKALEARLEVPGESEKVISMSENLQGLAQTLATRAVKLKTGSDDNELTRMANSINVAAGRVFDALEAIRWEAMEAQADADIAAGRTRSFTSKESLMDFLNGDSK